MFGASELTDDQVAAAVNGRQEDTSRVLELVSPQVHLMVTARLSPTPAQFNDVEETSQLAMVVLSHGAETRGMANVARWLLLRRRWYLSVLSCASACP